MCLSDKPKRPSLSGEIRMQIVFYAESSRKNLDRKNLWKMSWYLKLTSIFQVPRDCCKMGFFFYRNNIFALCWGSFEDNKHHTRCLKITEKKSHSTLRAKRASFTFWVDKSWLKMPKMVHFGEFLKTWSLRSNSVTRPISFNRPKNWWKMPKFENSNE